MLPKLLSLVGLVVPCATGLPPVIYAASTSANYRELWKVQIDYNGALDVCFSDNKKYLLKYQLKEPISKEMHLEAFWEGGRVAGMSDGKLIDDAEVMWTHGENKFLIRNGEHGDSDDNSNVYCTGSDGTFKSIGQQQGYGQWKIKIKDLSKHFRIQEKGKCLRSIFKVICSVELNVSDVNGWGWETKGSDQLTVNWKLPKLIYTPF